MNTRPVLDTKYIVLAMLGVLLLETACGMIVRDTTYHDTLRLDFEANRDQAQVGEPVHMRFVIKNIGKQPIVIESQDTSVMDIIVQVVGGETLLSWSARNPEKASHRIGWKPNESRVVELTWIPKQGDIYSGAYRDIYLTGLLSEDSRLVRAAGVRICASDVCIKNP
jgi:hypothetical protein